MSLIENKVESCKEFVRILQKDLTYTHDTLETTMYKGFEAREVSPDTSPRPPVELRNNHRLR
jgi:hypothetical protein